MQGLTLTCVSPCLSVKEVTENVLCCLIQENTLQSEMHYYLHTIITENQTNYATLCLLATLLIQACLKIQNSPFKTKTNLYLT